MERNLGFIVGGLALATTVALGGVDNSKVTRVSNAPPIAEVKVPVIDYFNLFSSNNVSYVEMKGKINTSNYRKYSIQATTNLASNVWQDVCTLESCIDSKRIEFRFLDSCNSFGKYYRLKYNK